MSLEAHHRFILDTMQRNQDIARNIINELEAENARLKAEVERLKMEESKLLTLCETYEGDLERLRKAGDSMVKHIRHGEEVCYEIIDGDEVIQAWNTAKEGKQP